MKCIIHLSNTSSSEDDGFQPEDTIKRSRQPNGVDRRDSDRVDLLVTYANLSCPFPLRDLAIIAQTVVASADASADSLLMQKCYWLTRTLVGITIERYHPQPVGGVKETAYHRSGRISRLPFVPVINEDNPAEITAFVECVNRAIEADDLQVREYLHFLCIYSHVRVYAY